MAIVWREVSTENHPGWRSVFNAEPRSEALATPCPVCGTSTLHRWYAVDSEDDIELGGQRYVGRGRLWEWCSSCGSYEHFRDGYVPEWWRSVLVIPHDLLTYDPGPIELLRRNTAI